ncbi:MAG TPA: YdjY domain-containing protein [Candidatus Binatus sp.]|nr:YdjY domain-containing protein [Candidatus Binatus sp.]
MSDTSPRVLLLVGALSMLCPSVGRGQPAAMVQRPPIEDRGNGRYRIGGVKLDQKRQRFAVRGVILRDEPPLEFLAVTADGFKAYESLLKVRANAHEFNLACILIGLDPEQGKPSRRHFDPEPAGGDPVDLRVTWRTRDGARTDAWTTIDAADLVRSGEGTLSRGEWVYTGSRVLPDGRFLAAVDSTLIGFVHDPASIIEHRTGLLGQFASVTVNRRVAPAVGTPVTVHVARPGSR